MLFQQAHVAIHTKTARTSTVSDMNEAEPNIVRCQPQDYHRILQWNQKPPHQANECVHTLISRQFEDRAEATAVEAWDGTYTYAELDRLSSLLAAHLSQLGVGAEIIVPLYFEKSRWTVVAMLSVMKAGGAFVLLDESQPFKRMQLVCREINASIIVASHRFALQAQDLVKHVVTLSQDSLLSLTAPDNWIAPKVSPNTTLYVIFTSGSTGQPKGVVVDHSAFSSNAMACAKPVHLDHNSRVFQFSSYTWSIAIEDTLSTLVAGGCICIPSNDDRMSDLVQSFNSLRANYIDLAPTVARSIDPATLPGLKTMIIGGEPLLKPDVDKWAAEVDLVNVFGVSECGIVTTRRISPGSSDASNIGRGAGCITWILDPDDDERLMPVGSIGEFVIEGPIVARGYLNLPDRTASAFIDPPAWRKDFPLSFPPGRFYKTGDLCQYVEDGSIRCLGRKDSQVLIGGQRVELEEVEHHVMKCFPHARQVRVVFLPPDSNLPGNLDGLVAFIDGHEGDRELSPTCPGSSISVPTNQFCRLAREASKELRDTIPNYMVPSHFLPLYQMPKLESGKVDIQCLKKEARSLTTDQIRRYGIDPLATKRAPEIPTEKQLQQVWAEVLGLPIEQIGADDDFFSLGGRSLDAMQLVTRARRHGLHFLTVAMIFKFPTLSALAAQVSQASGDEVTTSALYSSPFRSSDLKSGVIDDVEADQVECIFPVTDFQNIWLIPGLKNFDLWKISQPVNAKKMQETLQKVVDRHGILRTIFVPHKEQDRLMQVVLSRLSVPFTQREVEASEHDAFCQSFCQQDMDKPLRQAEPYINFTMVSSGDSNHTLIFRTSHAQWDMRAWEVIMQDIADTYHQRELPAITADFTAYMQHRLAKSNDKAWRFWKSYLDGASMTVLPDSPAGDARRNLVGVSDSVPHPPPIQGITVATLVKAAWALMMARLTGKKDLTFGHTVNGRSLGTLGLGEEDVVGCCVNTVPIRVIIPPTWTARQLLVHVQNQYTQTIQHELVEPSDIVKNCTTWAADTDFNSVVTHDHHDVQTVVALEGGSTVLQPVYPDMREDSRKAMKWPLQVVTHSEKSKLCLGILGFNDVICQDRAQFLLDKFAKVLIELSNTALEDVVLSLNKD